MLDSISGDVRIDGWTNYFNANNSSSSEKAPNLGTFSFRGGTCNSGSASSLHIRVQWLIRWDGVNTVFSTSNAFEGLLLETKY
jgi:hypothetical protein